MKLRLAVLAALVALGCPPMDNPPVSRCEGVRCPSGERCDLASGLCVGADGGVRDGGGSDAGADAGRVDAGADAGRDDAGRPVDGGFDAGLDAGVIDGGLDAGFDAGPTGCLLDADCFGVRNRCDTRTGACVECLIDGHCPSAIPKCDVLRNECVECLSNVDCQNPRPTCRAQVCDDCNALTECGPGQTCELLFGDCVVLPDSCAAPQLLGIPDAGGSAFVTVDLVSAVDDVSTSCGQGADLVYAFDLAGPRDVTVSARALGGATARPTVAVRAASCASGSELACDSAPDGGAGASVVLPGLAAGRYFVVLESASGTSGRVELGVTVAPGLTAAPNDTCAQVEPLAFFGTRAVAVGSTVLATNDGLGPSCSPTAASSGGDLIYSYDVDGGSSVTVTARPLAGSTLQPVVSVRPVCASAANELACGASGSLSLPTHPAGRFVVAVDSANGSAGAFQLEVTRTPIVANDRCPGLQALVFQGSVATATGDTSFASNDSSADATPSCSASARTSGQDVVFSYTLTQARDVTVSITPTGPSPTFWPVLSIRNACSNGAGNAELACVSPNASLQARASLVNQPAGTYTVWVDSAATTAGPFQLEVVTAPPTLPPSNDSCASPLALAFAGNVASASGSTVQAANDSAPFEPSPTCSATARQNGRDVVYSFSLAAPQDVAIEVTPSAGSLLRPVLYVRRASCTTQLLADELVCLERVGPARAVLTNLAAGTYFVFVDGAGGSAGAFSLSVTRSAPTSPPANDECLGAQSLVFTNDLARVSATTFGATNSNGPTDNAPACGADFVARRWGRDLAYSYTLTAPRDVEVRVTPAAGSPFAPVVYVRSPGQCASGFAGSELGCGAPSLAGAAYVSLPNQAAGTYPLFVDSDSYETGPFTLEVRLSAPTGPPSNDTCSSPQALSAGAAVAGSTVGAANDYALGSTPAYPIACGRAFNDGRDVVYVFTAPTAGAFTATVTPTGAFDPALLQLNGACSAAQCVRGADLGGPGAAESITFTATAGQTVFFVVDSASAAAPFGAGAFTFRVQ
ncbi:MAG: hypothetical protein SFW67_34325 [Myxococcaceae bacterium]|nr:hypothetical protein [Myxococcaceae bacterium]